ncbi:MAG: sigma-54 dependent transcriptional regulator [Proteobacteria bacterium]|nr:sigma-54 dependent transcriptional regulator [Pseudomonadota bacterium]
MPAYNAITKLLLGTGLGVLSFLCGLLLFWFILKPIKQFVKKTESLPIFQERDAKERRMTREQPDDEIQYYSQVLSHATDILGKIEATRLFPEIIGHCNAMRQLFTHILKVAPSDATVLIMGESGTGKELVADAVYRQSHRFGKPFVKINCVAIPESLLESEFFGHEKGSFTGAIAQQKGKFEVADKGTIFLDEIGDITPAMQAKLLRVMQEKEFSRVGSNKSINIDVRFIAATNKNLPDMVKKGEFREDLYHRLNVFPMVLPPLRKRDDISDLTYYFLENLTTKKSKQIPNDRSQDQETFKIPDQQVIISQDALEYLESYSWPGNVRELKNTIERAALMSDTGAIEISHLPLNILEYGTGHANSFQNGTSLPEGVSMDDHLSSLEKRMIISALIKSRCKQVAAAELLNINTRSLWHRIKKYQIDVASLQKQHNLE